MADPVEVDVNTIQYVDGNGNPIPNGGSGGGSGSGSGGGGVLAGILGAIPGILSALFPSGVGGGGGSSPQYPYVTTQPGGTTSVNLAGSGTNNILLIALVAMVAYLVFTGKPPVKAKK